MFLLQVFARRRAPLWHKPALSLYMANALVSRNNGRQPLACAQSVRIAHGRYCARPAPTGNGWACPTLANLVFLYSTTCRNDVASGPLSVRVSVGRHDSASMNWLSQNITQIFQFLPGFITAAIFYALTAHPKTTEFERVIQALLFTLILKVSLFPIRASLFLFGRHFFSLGEWTQDSELVGMVLLAIPLGLICSYLAYNDAAHAWARAKGLTSRTSFPSEWFGAFSRSGQSRWVILHIKGSRRLYGWPEEWPDQPDKGHFVIEQPEWVLEDGTRIPIHQTSRFLIPATEVEFVELLAHQHELCYPKSR